MENDCQVVVIVSANAEWRAVRQIFPEADYQPSPYGEWFITNVYVNQNDSTEKGKDVPIIFFNGGWGKIAAAASTQYVIDRWKPELLINMGTCGGFEGEIQRGEILLIEKTIVYDIIEQMGDYDEGIAHYTTTIDLSWLNEPFPHEVQRTLIISGDRDLLIEEVPQLKGRYQARAGDWESGAIAFVAARNSVKLLILRGVTDLVGASGGEAYGNKALFDEAALKIMNHLVEALPGWLKAGNIV